MLKNHSRRKTIILALAVVFIGILSYAYFDWLIQKAHLGYELLLDTYDSSPPAPFWKTILNHHASEPLRVVFLYFTYYVLHSNNHAIGLTFFMFNILAALCFFLFAKRTLNIYIAFGLAILALFHPALIGFTTMGHYDVVTFLLSAIVIFLTFKIIDNNYNKHFLLKGFFLGFVISIIYLWRGFFSLYWIIPFFLLLLLRRWRVLICYILTIVILIGSYQIKNIIKFHSFTVRSWAYLALVKPFFVHAHEEYRNIIKNAPLTDEELEIVKEDRIFTPLPVKNSYSSSFGYLNDKELVIKMDNAYRKVIKYIIFNKPLFFLKVWKLTYKQYWASSWGYLFNWDFFPTVNKPYRRIFHYKMMESVEKTIKYSSSYRSYVILYAKIPFLQFYNILDYFTYLLCELFIPIILLLGVFNIKRILKSIVEAKYNKEIFMFVSVFIFLLYNIFMGSLFDGAENNRYRLYVDPFLWWLVTYLTIGISNNFSYSVKNSKEVQLLGSFIRNNNTLLRLRIKEKIMRIDVWLLIGGLGFLSFLLVFSTIIFTLSVFKEENILIKLWGIFNNKFLVSSFSLQENIDLKKGLQVVVNHIMRSDLNGIIVYTFVSAVIFVMLLVYLLRNNFCKTCLPAKFKRGYAVYIIALLAFLLFFSAAMFFTSLGLMQNKLFFIVISFLFLVFLMTCINFICFYVVNGGISIYCIGGIYSAILCQISSLFSIAWLLNIIRKRDLLYISAAFFWVSIFLILTFWFSAYFSAAVISAKQKYLLNENTV